MPIVRIAVAGLNKVEDKRLCPFSNYEVLATPYALGGKSRGHINVYNS